MDGDLVVNMALRIDQTQWDTIVDHVKAAAPEEACGMLSGHAGEVFHVYPAENELHSPVSFRMKPSDQLTVFQQIETDQEELVGIYHSHPKGPREPSEKDKMTFAYPGVIYLILFQEKSGWMGRSYCMDSEPIEQIDMQIITKMKPSHPVSVV